MSVQPELGYDQLHGPTPSPSLSRRRPRSFSQAWDALPKALRYSILVVVLLGVWQAYITLGHASPLLVASPLAVAKAIVTGIASGKIPHATLATLRTLITGILIGAFCGFVFASFAVFSRLGHDLLSVLIAVMNPLPAIAILPLAMLWFGLSEGSIIFVVALATVWPVAINADTGFRTISATTQMVARNLGLRGWRMVTDVLLPAALPYIIAGLKAAWAFGWRTVVAAELVFGVAGSSGGLGWYINIARYYLQIPDMFAGLVVISILGIFVEFIFGFVEGRTIVKWGMKTAK